MTEDQEESLIFNHIREWDDMARLSYARIGLECKKVYSRLLWKHRLDPETGQPCHSFARWAHLAAPWGYSTCYAAMKDVEALQDVPAEHLAQIPQSNFETMKSLSTAVRSRPEVLHAAKTQHNDQFVETIKRQHPEQHLEHRKPMRFTPSETQAADIEEALRLAMEHGAANRNEALWALAVDFKASAMMEEAHANSQSAQ